MLATGTQQLSLDLSPADGKRKAGSETSVLFCSYVTWMIEFAASFIITLQLHIKYKLHEQIILLVFCCFECLECKLIPAVINKKQVLRCSCRYRYRYYCALLHFPYLQTDEEKDRGTLKALLPSSCQCQTLWSASWHSDATLPTMSQRWRFCRSPSCLHKRWKLCKQAVLILEKECCLTMGFE